MGGSVFSIVTAGLQVTRMQAEGAVCQNCPGWDSVRWIGDVKKIKHIQTHLAAASIFDVSGGFSEYSARVSMKGRLTELTCRSDWQETEYAAGY